MPFDTTYATFGSAYMPFANAYMSFGLAHMPFANAYMPFGLAYMPFATQTPQSIWTADYFNMSIANTHYV
jgi:hypothetical protein